MKAKVTEKTQAIQLRKQGYSLNEISDLLSISKASASLWLYKVPLSKLAQLRIARKREEGREQSAKTIRARTDRKIKEALQSGEFVVDQVRFDKNISKIVCALLYWCEGVKIRRRGIFGFTNSDPQLVRSFLKLMRESFEVDEKKFAVTVHIHDYHDTERQLRFWSKVTSIPLAQFHKPYRKPHTGIRKRDGYEGCASIRYYDVRLAREIEGIAQAYLARTGL